MIAEGWGGAEGEICWFWFLNNFFRDTDILDSTVEYRIAYSYGEKGLADRWV